MLSAASSASLCSLSQEHTWSTAPVTSDFGLGQYAPVWLRWLLAYSALHHTSSSLVLLLSLSGTGRLRYRIHSNTKSSRAWSARKKRSEGAGAAQLKWTINNCGQTLPMVAATFTRLIPLDTPVCHQKSSKYSSTYSEIFPSVSPKISLYFLTLSLKWCHLRRGGGLGPPRWLWSALVEPCLFYQHRGKRKLQNPQNINL